MKCPYCGTEKDKVIDSRLDDSNNAIRRKRECSNCGKRFTTIEIIYQKDMQVKKKSGALEVFNRDKIRAGIVKACEKLKVSNDQIDNIVSKVEQLVFNSSTDEICSTEVGEFVMQELKAVNEVAYVRYASIYKQFKDLDSWIEEIKKIQSDRK